MFKKEIASYFLVTFTLMIVALSLKYFLTEPLYESSSVIEIGKQIEPGKDLNELTLSYIESPKRLELTLNSLYGDLIKVESFKDTGILEVTSYGNEPVVPYELIKSVNKQVIQTHKRHYDASLLVITQAVNDAATSIKASDAFLKNGNKSSISDGSAEMMKAVISLKLKLNYLLSTVDAGPSKILREPVKATKPIGPNLMKYILAGVIGGGGLALFAVFVGLYIRDKRKYLLDKK